MIQFNKESTPKRLGNWEVPRWAPSRARPLEMRANPKPICDINGRFLPGAPRGTSRCFGHFTGTWDLPRKITRKVAEELAKEPPDGRFSDWLNPRVQRPKAAATASGRLRGGKRAKGKEDVKENGNTQTFVYQKKLTAQRRQSFPTVLIRLSSNTKNLANVHFIVAFVK
ncbi:protein Flattop [Bombyx mori]|uniref:protein Flattop n=1 Tax=Bombyx mori TaxID=7091 RepID=UPI002ED16A0F